MQLNSCGSFPCWEYRNSSARENGCVRYDYYLPADGSADCVILVEEWQTAELQALHMEQPHMKRLAEIKIRYVSPTTVDIIAEQPTSALS